MQTYLDCIPCFLRQALDAVRLVTDDERVHARLLRDVLRDISSMDLTQTPPQMGQHIHHLLRRLTQADPYRPLKAKCPVIAKSIGVEVGTLVLQRSDIGRLRQTNR